MATYTFGPFLIDSGARLLFREAERVSLPPKAADVLIALLEREGQLVTKDELLKEVWPDTFVEEGNLARHIFLLRKTLGETPDGASYVETVPKRGYRFIGPVQRDHSNLVTLTAEERTSEHIVIEEAETLDPPRRHVGRRRAVIAVGLMIAAGILASLVWARTRTPMPVRSLLVLPFANLSMAADSEYFSDGLTEELIGAFSAVRGLRVVPRTTAFQFKGKSGDVRAIGRQLEADAVLDGGVQRSGDHLRIRLSLTRVSDGSTIWSHAWDRKTQDVFAMQEEIARSVLRAVFPNEQHRIDVPPPSGTRNPEAQNLYLKANFIRQKFVNSSLTDALALFQKATDLDPGYAQAWAGQAFCYAEIGYGYQRYPKDVFPLAVQATDRALVLNPRLALAHAVRGYVNLVYLRDWEASKRELETAIELDPNDGESHHWMSHYWVSAGRFREATEEARRALEADPLNFSIGSHQAWLELEKGARTRNRVSWTRRLM
jgi:TolB-like protein/DNA-binding winged helix-turn-helix (wHTH) protein/Tfp pilus assembly protein PilF